MNERYFSPEPSVLRTESALLSTLSSKGNRLRMMGSPGKLVSNVHDQPVKKIGSYVYDTSKQIGSGYSSKVYKATSSQDRKEYAVKVIQLKRYSVSSRQMLDTEISILRAMDHPNIIKCYEVFRSATHCHIITQYCAQGDLLAHLTKFGKLNELQAVEIISQVVQGVKYLLKKNILHRDLKPANILCNKKQWKIADFGFAIESTGEVRTRQNVGTPLYMPLEALEKNIYSPQTDIFALGVMFYQLLIGVTPWECKSEKQLIKKMTILPFTVPDKICLSEAIAATLGRLCSLDISKRVTKEQFLTWIPINDLKIFCPPLQIQKKNSKKRADTLKQPTLASIYSSKNIGSSRPESHFINGQQSPATMMNSPRMQKASNANQQIKSAGILEIVAEEKRESAFNLPSQYSEKKNNILQQKYKPQLFRSISVPNDERNRIQSVQIYSKKKLDAKNKQVRGYIQMQSNKSITENITSSLQNNKYYQYSPTQMRSCNLINENNVFEIRKKTTSNTTTQIPSQICNLKKNELFSEKKSFELQEFNLKNEKQQQNYRSSTKLQYEKPPSLISYKSAHKMLVLNTLKLQEKDVNKKDKTSNNLLQEDQDKIQKRNQNIFNNQLLFCRFMYYMTKNIDCFLLCPKNKISLTITLYSHIIRLLKNLSNDKKNQFHLRNWDQFRKSKTFFKMNITMKQYFLRYQKEFKAYQKSTNQTIFAEVKQQLENQLNFLVLSPFFYQKLKEQIAKILREFNHNLTKQINEPKAQVNQKIKGHIQAIKSLYKYYNLLELMIIDFQSFQNFGLKSNIKIIIDYSHSSQVSMEQFLQLRKNLKNI